MLAVLTIVLLACAGLAVALRAIGVWASLRHARLATQRAADTDLPPVSLLKPIKGREEELEQNLRSFFEQDYPAPIELVFASTELDDPGIDLARRLAREYPHVPARFVRSDPTFGLNPKVSNLRGALDAARYDLVLQSDANCRVKRGYLRAVVGEMLGAGGSLLTSMVVGTGERSVGAAMENLQLSAFIAPAMCTALHLAGIPCVVGKSMLFRKSELEEVGGLELVRDILAEDFILGETYTQMGKRVVLSGTTVENVNRDIPVTQFLGRHARWLKMRAAIHVGAFVADLLANPTPLLAAAFVTSAFDLRVGAALLLVLPAKIALDAFHMRLARGSGMRLAHLLLAPMKDGLMALVWVYSIFSRSVVWRGTRLRFGRDSRLRPDDGALPVRLARRVFTPFD